MSGSDPFSNSAHNPDSFSDTPQVQISPEMQRGLASCSGLEHTHHCSGIIGHAVRSRDDWAGICDAGIDIGFGRDTCRADTFRSGTCRNNARGV